MFASLGARFVASLLDLIVITIPSLIISRLLDNAPGRAGDAAVTAFVSLYFIVSYSAAGGGYSRGQVRARAFASSTRAASRSAWRRRRCAGSCRSASRCRWPSSRSASRRGVPLQTGPAFAICVPILCVVVRGFVHGHRAPRRAIGRCTISRRARMSCGAESRGRGAGDAAARSHAFRLDGADLRAGRALVHPGVSVVARDRPAIGRTHEGACGRARNRKGRAS